MLIRTTDPKCIYMLYPWVQKYLTKIPKEYHGQELAYFISAFKKNSPCKLFVSAEGHGYVLLSEEPYRNGLYGLQISTDDVQLIAKEVKRIAERMGYTKVFWSTHRDGKSFARLVNAEITGTILSFNA